MPVTTRSSWSSNLSENYRQHADGRCSHGSPENVQRAGGNGRVESLKRRLLSLGITIR